MKYILDSSGYIDEVSFGASIVCKGNTCVDYTGTIPSGYTSLEEWADNSNIRAYNIVSGNLNYDAHRDMELEAEWNAEAIRNVPEIVGNKVTSISSSSTDTQYPSAKAVYTAIGGSGGITLLDVYPVGAIYMSVSNTNPSTLFGGTWEAWGGGRVPVGVWSGDIDFNEAEKWGGSKTHTLTEAEMPLHRHNRIEMYNNPDWTVGDTSGIGGTQTDAHTVQNTSIALQTSTPMAHYTTSPSGGGQSHNNMPPYITCYMWKRTA